MQEVREDTPAFPNAPQSSQELSWTQEPGSLVGSSWARSRSSQGVAPSSSTRHYTAENQRLGDELAVVQHVQAEWQGRAGVEVNDFLCQPGETDRIATFVLHHEGRICMSIKKSAFGGRWPKLERCWPMTRPALTLPCVLRGAKSYRPLPGCARKPEDAHEAMACRDYSGVAAKQGRLHCVQCRGRELPDAMQGEPSLGVCVKVPAGPMFAQAVL